jgi:hypothetical protein
VFFDGGDVVVGVFLLQRIVGVAADAVERTVSKQVQHLGQDGRISVVVQVRQQVAHGEHVRIRVVEALIDIREKVRAVPREPSHQIPFLTTHNTSSSSIPYAIVLGP